MLVLKPGQVAEIKGLLTIKLTIHKQDDLQVPFEVEIEEVTVEDNCTEIHSGMIEVRDKSILTIMNQSEKSLYSHLTVLSVSKKENKISLKLTDPQGNY